MSQQLSHACLLACCLLSIGLVAAQQSKTPIRDALQREGYTHFLVLTRAAGIEEPSPSALLTVFAPTNKAIDEFLAKMKVSLDDIKGRPGLAAAVVAFHVLPRVKGRVADVKGATRAQPVVAITADDTHYLRFFDVDGSSGKVAVEDVQNNTANIVSKGTEVGNLVFFGVDKVLLSGDVFLTLDNLLSVHPEFMALRKLYADAGLEAEVQAMGGASNTLTVFAPTAEAVKAAQAKISALSKADLQDVLRYHIVPAALPIPAGLQADKAYETAFKGHSLKFKYTKVPSTAAKGSSNSTLAQRQQEEARQTVEVIPEAGTFGGAAVAGTTQAKVTIANLFANRMVIHGISQVLKPNLAQGGAGGRKLQQFRQGAGAAVISSSMTATQSSIRDAVEGRSAVWEATQAGGASARIAAARCWNCLLP